MNFFKVVFFVFFIISNVFGQKNNLSITYKTISTLDVEGLDPEIKSNTYKLNYLKKIQKNFEEIEYNLKISENKSFFKVKRQITISSNVNPVAVIENKQSFYIDDEEFLEQKEFLGTEYLIFDLPNKQKWEVGKETKKILNFLCYKANLKIDGLNPLNIEAWFAPELHFSFGPKGFHGLPGLILEVTQNENLTYRASAIEYDDEVFIIKPTSGKKITRDKYKKLVDEQAKTMLGLYGN
jgi:GLPGLI family protein